MNAKFHPALKAIQADDVEKFKALVAADPSLATSRSTRSHPTLLQAVALDGKDKPHNVEMAQVLIDAGAELDEPLVAAASIDNRAVAELLLDHGAAIDGTGGWTPLEEALYWNNRNVLALLLERGAKVQNLRTAAGLGRIDLIENYFNTDGTLKPEAGKLNWPWGDPDIIAASNHPAKGKQSLVDRVKAWSQDQQGIVDNAFVYACMHGHIEAAKLLLDKGAGINAIPGGFDYAGTGLHYAALNGHRPMIEFLLAHGADLNVKDTKVGSTAAGWAEYGGHPELRELLAES
ncbi:MAG TPA: ankyrin repeat domain-containing protein [Pyrinomonadaceae bacterium]|nr:ankyrin repeat domain-containing protein [Pyrinomonadaceae bacterium]